MAVNAYLTIDTIPGPSTSRPNAIDVLSFSWGASQTATYGTGASGQESKAGRADFHHLSIMKVTDKTTPFLFDACVNATNIGKELSSTTSQSITNPKITSRLPLTM